MDTRANLFYLGFLIAFTLVYISASQTFSYFIFVIINTIAIIIVSISSFN